VSGRFVRPQTASSSVFHLSHYLHDLAFSAVDRLVGVLGFLDLGDKQLECLADVLVVAGASLGPSAVELFRQLPAVLLADLSLLRPQIALVTHNNDRDTVRSLQTKRVDAACQSMRSYMVGIGEMEKGGLAR